MIRFLRNKWFWTFLLLGGLGFFVLVLLSNGNQASLREVSFPDSEFITQDITSFIYFYDKDEKTYIPEPEISQAWHKQSFVRYILDAAKEATLQDCEYFLYDAKEQVTTVFAQRPCNSELEISVGKGAMCPSQGERACLLYVYAQDDQGRSGEMSIANYNIDFEPPKVGQVFFKEDQEYPLSVTPGQEILVQAMVSDNQEVLACWLYQEEGLVGRMEISSFVCTLEEPCLLSALYTAPEHKERDFLAVQCADHFDPVLREYVNVAWGQSVEVAIARNHAPEIVSCRVTPSKGTQQDEFQFFLQAHDPDEDSLTFEWDFGDQVFSNEKDPVHTYEESSTFQPKVVVRDPEGQEDTCFTAWVQVSE